MAATLGDEDGYDRRWGDDDGHDAGSAMMATKGDDGCDAGRRGWIRLTMGG